jgi:phage shock protein A
MTAELSDWLTELGEAQPAIAAEVVAMLVAVLECAEPAELGLAGRPARPDPRETVDHGYQQLLMDLQAIRQRSARVTDALTAAEQQLSARRAEGAGPAEIGTLAAELAAARQSAERLTRRHQQLQHEVDAFRAAKETAKATYTAAEAQVRVAEALADMSEFDEAEASSDKEFAAAAAAAADSVRLLEAVRAAGARLRQLAGQSQVADAPVAGLLELRADPLGTDTRILFAVEPADTVTLLAVLDGPDAVGQYGAQAVRLAGELLTEIREQGWPDDLDSAEIADADEFLAR